MPTQFHLLLAVVSAVATAGLAAEAAWRALRNLPRSTLSRWLSAGQLISLAITSLAGFGLVALGTQPGDSVHYLLAVLALLLPPGVSMFAVGARPRTRAAATSLAAALALIVVGLLFATG